MNRRRSVIITVVVVVAAVLSISLHMVLGNRAPVIASLEAGGDRVFPSGSTELVCTVSDADGDELSYAWSASGGEIEGQGATVTWMAPDQEGDHDVTVTVTDSRRAEDMKHVTITVMANRPPEIDSLMADAAWSLPSGSLQVMCDASDPDDHQLSYEWTATGGNITDTGATVDWTAPQEAGKYDIAVVVTDGHGGSDTRTLSVTVVTGQPAVIEALEVTGDRHGHCALIARRFGYSVREGEKYDIKCIASHPDGLGLSYEWEWDAGEVFEISEDGAMITWIAPDRRAYVTVTVRIHDIAGNMISESIGLDVPCSPCTRWPQC